MFNGKPYEKLSRSTQYRIRKILFKSDDEVEDCSNRGSNVSRETDGSDTSSVCPGFDYLKSTDDDSDCCETINGCCDDYDNDEQDDNFMDCSDYTEETESISPDNNGETESIGPDNNEDTESVSSDKNNFEEWNESQSNASGSDNDESDFSTDDSSFFNENLNSPLYPNSPLTLGESVLCILSYMIRHKITKAALADLLWLLKLHCAQPNCCIKSVYYFRQFFKNIQAPISRHFFCSACFFKLNDQNNLCPNCNKKEEASYFIRIPLVTQLLNLFKRPGFYNSLQGRFNRQKINEKNLEDIWDGSVYQSLFKNNGFLSIPLNISFTWNTDGISLFKSSKFSLWPFYLTINELPFKDRTKKENLLLAGIWFGVKPQPNLFLKSFWNDLKKIFQGIWCKVTDLNSQVKVRGKIICGTCDLPAKSAFLNMKGHMSVFGCCHCKIQSKYFNKRRIYPFKKKLVVRTTKQFIADSKKAVRTKKAVNGIKGPSVLTIIVHDVFKTTVVDSMHCVYLGVVRKVFSLLFDSCYSENVFSLHKHLRWVDEKIRSISPPAFVSRLTRSVYDYKYWKASEWKQWLLYYLIPILSSIMSDEYLEHHKLLVTAISYLSSTSISQKIISVAFTSIKIYTSQFNDLYGLIHMTCNLHCLYHLPDAVRKFGPLPGTSCFAYENLNGSFGRLVQGTRYAQLQICSSLSLFTNFIELKSEARQENNNVKEFCKKLELFHLRKRKLVYLSDQCSILGKITPYNLTDSLQIIFENSDINLPAFNNIYKFARLFKNKLVYDSELYKRKRKTNSSIVVYNHNNRNYIGVISEFIKVCSCQNIPCDVNCITSNFFAIITKYLSIESIIPNALIDMVDLCIKSDQLQLAININNLITVCFSIDNDDDSENNTFFVMRPINLTEID